MPDWTLRIIPPRNISDKFTIIWDLCKFLQPGLISSTIFSKKLDFPTINHNSRCIKTHWAQFPMIGNTYLEQKLLKNPLLKLPATTIQSLINSLKGKRLPKLSNKEIYFTFLSNIISNSIKYNLSNSFHGQTSLKNTIFSVLISDVKYLLIHNWFKKCLWIAS